MKRLVLCLLPVIAATATIASAASAPVSSQHLTVDAPTVCAIEPSGDASVDQAAPDTNLGTGASLAVTSLLAGNRRALVHFDLGACGLPASPQILSARLTVYLETAPALGRTHGAHRVTSAWTATGVTWNTQPSSTSLAAASVLTGIVDGATRAFDVTADVSSFVSGASTNHGWLVKDTLEDDLLGATGIYSSREHATVAQRPVLAVTYR